MIRHLALVVVFVFAIVLAVATPVMAATDVVEQLRLRVPAAHREVWLDGERSTWQPWLEAQTGFLGRDLYWDPQREEGVLLIRWASRSQWKAISDQEVERVQASFDSLVKAELGLDDAAPSPFPLLAEGELQLQRLQGDARP